MILLQEHAPRMADTTPPPIMAIAAALLGALAGCDDGAAPAAAQPTGAAPVLMVVGDSLSDTGNAAAVADFLLGQPMYPEPSIGLCHPAERALFDRDCADILYRRSRVSDGPVAVEHLAAHVGATLEPSFHTVPDRPVVGTNYAVAGAKARGTTPRDLAHQVDRLLLDHGPRLPEGAVVVLMIGGNDAIDALQAAALPAIGDPGEGLPDPIEPAPPADPPAGAPEEEPGAVVAAAVDGIVTAASRLLDAGACVIVANVPDLARLPEVRDTAEREGVDVAAAAALATEVTAGFNAGLAERLAGLAAMHPAGASLVPFDLHTSFQAALDAAEAAGTNVTDACFDSERYSGSEVGERVFHPACAPASDAAPGFDGFFFWDGIHPTGAAHGALGAALVDAYETGCAAGAAAEG